MKGKCGFKRSDISAVWATAERLKVPGKFRQVYEQKHPKVIWFNVFFVFVVRPTDRKRMLNGQMKGKQYSVSCVVCYVFQLPPQKEPLIGIK